MRSGEVHGTDYFFVSRQQFEEWMAAGELLEHAVVYGEYKGIPRRQVEDALARGTDVVLRLDVQVGMLAVGRHDSEQGTAWHSWVEQSHATVARPRCHAALA